MECPVCGDRLRAVEKYGVEIDICPGYKGVWLDRGELDTILETAGGGDGTSPRSSDTAPRETQQHSHQTGSEDQDYDDRRPRSKKKTTKQGLLGGLMGAIGGGGGD